MAIEGGEVRVVYGSPSYGGYGVGVVPPQRWCGVHHAHGPHTWAVSGGTYMIALYASCPGSTCGCEDGPHGHPEGRQRV